MNHNDENRIRSDLLQSIGGDPSSVAEVMNYCENPFKCQSLPDCPVLPLPEEGHLIDWRHYVVRQGDDPFGFLQERIPQLSIPVQDGISSTDRYADVVQRGKPFETKHFQGKLALKRPDLFRLLIQDHSAGALPVLMVPERKDFETIVHALAHRNEPKEISPSVNAQMVAGLINWDRVHRYRSSWRKSLTQAPSAKAWAMEMRRVSLLESWRFLDRFIIATIHPYSSVSAKELGLPFGEEEWLQRSTVLRLEHEFTHYATKRLFGKMRLNLLDEILCDWAGITRAMGEFSSQWFLQLLGLERRGDIRPDGRIHTYRQKLSDPAFQLLAHVTGEAGRGLEALHRSHYRELQRDQFFLALTAMTLELLACPQRESIFSHKYADAGKFL